MATTPILILRSSAKLMDDNSSDDIHNNSPVEIQPPNNLIQWKKCFNIYSSEAFAVDAISTLKIKIYLLFFVQYLWHACWFTYTFSIYIIIRLVRRLLRLLICVFYLPVTPINTIQLTAKEEWRKWFITFTVGSRDKYKACEIKKNVKIQKVISISCA